MAATVASGGADAGFGLRAAAADYGLAFVPLVRERYFLAVRAKDMEKAPVVRLIDALKSAALRGACAPARLSTRAGAGSPSQRHRRADAGGRAPSLAAQAPGGARTSIASTSSAAALGNAATW